MKSPKPTAQSSETTPWSMLGGRGLPDTRAIVHRGPHGNGDDRSQSPSQKKIRRARRGFVHKAARPSVSALASLPVVPIGPASTYSRAALGAMGNLGGRRGRFKGAQNGKTRYLRKLNNQHFHSTLCSLWITRSGAQEGSDERCEREPGGRVDDDRAVEERANGRGVDDRERPVGGEREGGEELRAGPRLPPQLDRPGGGRSGGPGPCRRGRRPRPGRRPTARHGSPGERRRGTSRARRAGAAGTGGRPQRRRRSP